MTTLASFAEPTGEGWQQVGEFSIAFALSAIIGLERELKRKAAGIRTYTLVGIGAALFMLISKYGFTDVVQDNRIVLDPSRVAAQIVSGLGFIGGGIIFVRRDAVRGLTTAASVWLTAAVGAAAGAGLPILAVLATASYFVAILALPPVARLVSGRFGHGIPVLQLAYLDGQGLLRVVLARTMDAGFAVTDLATRHDEAGDVDLLAEEGHRRVYASMRLNGKGDVDALVATLSEVPGVVTVASSESLDEE